MSVREQFLTELAQEVRRWSYPEPLHYRGPADFVLRQGNWVRCNLTAPGFPKLCFHNAIGYAQLMGWSYVEGYALMPLNGVAGRKAFRTSGPELVHHAWCIDDAGRGVEVTWPYPGRCYRGVVFDVRRADDATWNGDACTLDDPNRGHPLLRQPWEGEREWTDAEIDDAAHERLRVAKMAAAVNAATIAGTDHTPATVVNPAGRRA